MFHRSTVPEREGGCNSPRGGPSGTSPPILGPMQPCRHSGARIPVPGLRESTPSRRNRGTLRPGALRPGPQIERFPCTFPPIRDLQDPGDGFAITCAHRHLVRGCGDCVVPVALSPGARKARWPTDYSRRITMRRDGSSRLSSVRSLDSNSSMNALWLLRSRSTISTSTSPIDLVRLTWSSTLEYAVSLSDRL